MNLSLLTSIFEDHFKRFETNNADLLKYIQLSKTYQGIKRKFFFHVN
jgi:hypothetical protein